jgi:iron complex outermembrane recepter protein
MRIAVVSAVFCLTVISLTLATEVTAAISKPIAIPAQDLGLALQAFAAAREMRLVYLSDDLRNVHTHGVSGDVTPREALEALLAGTKLMYRFLDENTVSIFPADTGRARAAASRSADFPAGTNHEGTSTQAVGNGSLWGGFRVAEASEPPTGTGDSVTVEEIIVTAQKKLERLQDVPVPVSILEADALVENNQLRLQDYLANVPGVSFTPGLTGTGQTISIRGINTGLGRNPTVGVLIDDIPVGSSTAVGANGDVPDIDPSDLARVEILRGPQGTLYGASSLGGLLKFVTVDPLTSGLSGNIQAGVSGVRNGAEAGYNIRASVNVPITDSLAIRASAFDRQDPGYFDNVFLGVNGINEARNSGGRLSALWQLTDTFSLKLNALYQDYRTDGADSGIVQNGLGDLQQNYIRGAGRDSSKTQLYSATLGGKIGGADLVVVSGYNRHQTLDTIDYTSAFGANAQAVYNVGGTLAPLTSDTKKYTQEVRLSGSLSRSIDWLVGGFYTDERSILDQDILATDPMTGAVAANGYQSPNPTTYKEYAGFADLTFHITDRLDVQIGGREAKIDQTSQQTIIEPIFTGGSLDPIVGTLTRSSGTPFTYLLTPSFKLRPDIMIYARLASGYRAGGSNIASCSSFGFPCQYSPDKTKDYELGLKADFLSRKLSLDVSTYYIDWNDIQVLACTFNSPFCYTTNASRAKSEGLELSVILRPVDSLSVSAWLDFSEAQLTEDFGKAVQDGGTYGVAGTQLPLNSRWSGHASLEQQFPLWGEIRGSFGGDVNYVGNRFGQFAADAVSPRQVYPSYTQLNLRATAKYGSWKAVLYSNNVTDRRAIVGGGIGDFPPNAFSYILPRTIGLNVTKNF